MDHLWIRDCNYCKNMYEALTMGICGMTAYTVEHMDDEEFAKECPRYENRWEYEEREK